MAESTTDVSIEIDELVSDPIKLKVREALHISEDIDHEIDKAAGDYGYYAVLAEKANSKLQRIEYGYIQWRGTAEHSKQREREAQRLKPLTKEQMVSYIHSLPRYAAFRLTLVKLTEQAGSLRAIAKAFEVKAGLVQTKASNRRKEMGISKRPGA